MPPRKKTAGPPPLTDDDVAELRSRVGAGDKPRVVVRAASAAVPAGTRGSVIRLGDPREGEFIVVRLGRDEVPFAPSELALPTRGRSAGTTWRASGATASARPSTSATRSAGRRGTATAGDRPAAAGARTTGGRGSGARAAKAPSAPADREPAAPAAPAASAGRGRTRSKARSTPPLTVTLRFADDRWTVEAQRGARRIAKPTTVRPGAVKAFADLVDDEDVRNAMSETVASSRAVVEERAKKLRAELDAAEAALREYEARRR